MTTKKLSVKHRRRAQARRSRRPGGGRPRSERRERPTSSEDFDHPKRPSPEAAWDEELPVD